MRDIWSKHPIVWEDEKNIYCSCVFTWQLHKLIEERKRFDKQIIIGGPATILMPEIITNDIIIGKEKPNALFMHCSIATKTSIGCIRKCAFCSVNRIEPEFKELSEWENKPILIDNNLLACSMAHFHKVIDGLKKLLWCDFNQGLDARLLKKEHAQRFAELKKPLIRLSFDSIEYENAFLNAYQLLKNEGISNNHIQVYVLIGFNDDPVDALYRLNLIRKLVLLPNPMRYQALNSKKRNEFVNEKWTDRLLKKYMRYFANLRITSRIPFEEFKY